MDIVSRLQAFFRGEPASTQKNYNGDWTVVGGSSDSVHESNLLLNNKEWVYIAIDRIASAVTSVPIRVMKYKSTGDDQEVFNGPLVEFLEAPGPGLTGKDFIYLNTVYKELTGNAFWERLGRDGITPLLPTKVRPVISGNTITAYEYYDGAQVRRIKLEDILHDRYIDPAKPYWGAGKLQKIARWVDTSTYTNEFLRMFFLNGATFGGFITTEEETEERIKMIKAGLANDHVGVANAHKIGVLPKGSDYKQTTSKMSDMEMGATDDRYRDKILAGFGVPKSIVGLVEDVNRANAEANEYTFAKYTIKPIVVDLIEFLNVHVAKKLDPTGQYYFDYEEFVPVNMEIELKERQLALGGQSYKTVNEVRAEQGLPPVDGGDVVYGPPFQSPLGSPSAYPEPVLPPESDDDDEDEPTPTKGKQRRVPGKYGRVKTYQDRRKGVETITNDIGKKLEDIFGSQDAMDALAHKNFVGRVESYLERVATAVRLFNSEQRQRVVGEIGRITKSSEKAVSKSDLFDIESEIPIMINFVAPLLRGLMTEQALAEWNAQGFDGEFDSGDKRLAKIVDLTAKRLAKTYNNTTAKLLKNALNQGISEGEGLADLTKRVQEIYEFSDQSRAKAVAHTESFYIANKGSLEAYRQSGVVKTQRWYTAEDERVCEFCYPMNGKIVDVGDTYFKKGDVMTGSDGGTLALDYRSIDVPPIHTNCRCFVRPELIEID